MTTPDPPHAQPRPGTVIVCDRCGDVTVASAPCTCATPYNPIVVRRRLRDALALGEQGRVFDEAARSKTPPAA